ncbi:MAG TPA: hypothetical protein VGQ83_20165, partial [Polyangia bacterium]
MQRRCPTCNAVFNPPLERCPYDGTPLVPGAPPAPVWPPPPMMPPQPTGAYARPPLPGAWAPPRKKSHAGLIVLIISLVVIVGGGAGAYFALTHYARQAMSGLEAALGDAGSSLFFTGDAGVAGLVPPDDAAAATPAPRVGAAPARARA